MTKSREKSSILCATNSDSLNWTRSTPLGSCAYAPSKSSEDATGSADVFYSDHYYCDEVWQYARDIPPGKPVQIKVGHLVRGCMDALAVNEATGLLALEVPNDGPRKFFTVITTEEGFQLKSTYNDKFVVNEGDFFYAKGDTDGYIFNEYENQTNI